ncbi:MxaL protein [Caballeronia sp. LZ034LL]|uniref:MxaL protein n=1 Tax=Caballeronia sp. LZ034LL TaxID=3038567 RepID=UPI0028625C59|nr:MxaL protein [Caballeronia sp. LZ034LL]MDR5837292.1 MxaL protein [Caballeronia sp. LZ034LL]
MRRGAIHLAFGSVAIVFAALALYDWSVFRHAQTVTREVHDMTINKPDTPDAAGEVRLARAAALAKAGRVDDAQHLLDPLAAQSADRRLQTAALFNLGNLYLREAAGTEAAGPIRSLPLLEQAKDRYRTALRITPGDWDARYNLERALWLAPEVPGDQDELDIKHQSTVRLRGAQSEDLP